MIKSDAMAEHFEASPANDLPSTPNYNICPTNPVHVVTSGGAPGRRALRQMRWGFVPHWYKTPNGGPLLINARAETIAKKPAFAMAARQRRCLIPATGFYEWTKTTEGERLPWYIKPNASAFLAFAGVWQSWDKGDDLIHSCAIVTTKANRMMSRLHHRMPVILGPADWALWLGEAGHGAARLMQPAPDDALCFWRVDPQVNSNRATGAALIEPLATD